MARPSSELRIRWIRAAAIVALSLGAAPLLAADDLPDSTPAATPAQLEFFEQKIRPVLVEHCYQCHSAKAEQTKQLKGGLRVDSRAGLRQGGDSGPAVVPGKPDDSPLLAALQYDGLQMPPKGKLSDQIIADFKTWIRDGAADPRTDGGAARRAAIDIAAGKQFWAYQPRRHHPLPPETKSSDWSRGWIDARIEQARRAQRLRPAPDASRETLVRRLYFDLVGLPPPPAEIDEFLADDAPDATQRLVERLLASPRFGERWGRHWLDVVRYAESLTLRGFILPEAWRYRDYVIDFYNADRRFDRFLAEQVAGDLLPAPSLDEQRRQLVATTFLALGNTNLEEQDKAQLRMDVVDEQLEVIGKGFLAQTLGCARCHDHKFDPIPTRDYYALAGILRSTKALEHANVSKWLEFPLPVEPQLETIYKEHEAKVAALEAELKTAKDRHKALASATSKGADGPAIVAVKDLPGVVLDDSQAKKVGEWVHSKFSQRYIGDGYSHDRDQAKGEKTLTFVPELMKAGIYEVRLAYTPGGNRATNVPVTVFSADGEKQVKVNQREQPPLAGRFISLGQHRFEANGQGFVIVANEGTDGHVIVDAVQFLPLDAAKPDAPATTAGSAKKPDGAAANSAAPPADPRVAELDAQVKQLEAQLKKLVASGPKRPMYMSVRDEAAAEVGDARVHIRGLVSNQGDSVPRGFLQVAANEPRASISTGESGRRELGEWLAAADNPLPARVYANRVWHWLLGSGIVRTCDNFGSTGELPSHPELLDELALRFVARDWSTKELVRDIALSRTYQQSADNQESAASDPDNRWLARASRRRLDAECLLDAILAASGQLRLDGGGPLLKPNLSADYGYEHQTTHRAVYWPLLRNALPELLELFDLADPSLVTGRRNVSTVAPQALFLLNDPLVLREARGAAQRFAQDEPTDDDRRLVWAYRHILGRKPTSGERQAALDYLAAQRALPAAAPSDRTNADRTNADEAGWTQLIQALFATLDFRYIE